MLAPGRWVVKRAQLVHSATSTSINLVFNILYSFVSLKLKKSLVGI